LQGKLSLFIFLQNKGFREVIMETILRQIEQAVIDGDRAAVLERVRAAVDAGVEPELVISRGLTPGLYAVGEKFDAGEYFLPDMMLAAEAMGAAVELLDPLIQGRSSGEAKAGRVVIGTVRGDLHSIGKDIVIMMLKASGFQVFDLGVDVPSERFVEQVQQQQADLLGISALMTTTIQEQKQIIERLKAAGLRSQVKVIVGGAPLSEEWAAKIGADAYAPDAIAGVKKAKALLGID
jgi:corrinoid protein of di/trimethylamine methyltransferase